jgi:hypothetical protein
MSTMSTTTRGSRMISLAGILAMVTFAASLSLPGPAAAQCGMPETAPCPGTLRTTYYYTATSPLLGGPGADDLLTLINPVGCSNPGLVGCRVLNQCAMIYVFDNNENLGECCGCPLTPQQPVSFSVQHNLTSNWGLSTEHTTGTIDIISSLTNTFRGQASIPGCNPAAQYTTSRELNGYILHNQTAGPPEVPLADAGDADPVTVNSLVSKCANLTVNNKAGFCICPPFLPSNN